MRPSQSTGGIGALAALVIAECRAAASSRFGWVGLFVVATVVVSHLTLLPFGGAGRPAVEPLRFMLPSFFLLILVAETRPEGWQLLLSLPLRGVAVVAAKWAVYWLQILLLLVVGVGVATAMSALFPVDLPVPPQSPGESLGSYLPAVLLQMFFGTCVIVWVLVTAGSRARPVPSALSVWGITRLALHGILGLVLFSGLSLGPNVVGEFDVPTPMVAAGSLVLSVAVLVVGGLLWERFVDG